MKKVVLGLFMCIMLTGCGKTLKCTSSFVNDAMGVDETYMISYDNDFITKITYIRKYDVFDENLKQSFETLINFEKSNYESKNIKYNYSNKKDVHTIEAFYEVDSMSEDVFNELVGTKNVDEYQKKLEEQGLICK